MSEAEDDKVRRPHPFSGALLRFAIGFPAGALVAVLVGYFAGAKPKDVVRYAAGVSPWLLFACALSSFVVLAFQSARWHAVMRPLLGLRYAQAYRAQIVGFLFNAILPARGGDLLRVQYLGRRTGKSRAIILGTEVVDRWLDWWGWIPTFLVLCVVSHPPYWLYHALLVFGALLSSWALAMLVLTRRGYTPRADTRVGRVLGALMTGIQAFRSPRTWAIAWLIAPLPWLWESGVIALSARAFGIHLGLLEAFSVLIGFNLAMVVPSPGGLGTVESGGTAALLFFGVDQSKAMAFMLLYHLSQLLPGVLGGVLVLIVEKEILAGPAAPAPEAPIE
jgi:glycosyltransferase 2 family protein